MTVLSGRCLAARATHASHRANLRCLGLSVGIAIALSGCGEQQKYFSQCLNSQTGERVKVVDTDWSSPTVEDGRGYQFIIYLSKQPEWRCKRTGVE